MYVLTIASGFPVVDGCKFEQVLEKRSVAGTIFHLPAKVVVRSVVGTLRKAKLTLSKKVMASD